MKPLIGITMLLQEQPSKSMNSLNQDYGQAVLAAGGFPVPILGITSSIPDIVKRLDGFVFSGGDDLHPRFYREQPRRKAPLTLSPDRRTQFEIKLLKAVLKEKKPVLAICHGAQLVNVALGGTLFQDIALQVSKAGLHKPAKRGAKLFHQVRVFEGTKLCSIVGSCEQTGDCTFKVRSSHHQSVKNPGRGLKLSAVAPDGIIEALEARGKQFLFAVQWHPEQTVKDRTTRRLFTALVNAAKK